jgi:hypothetical protein
MLTTVECTDYREYLSRTMADYSEEAIEERDPDYGTALYGIMALLRAGTPSTMNGGAA